MDPRAELAALIDGWLKEYWKVPGNEACAGFLAAKFYEVKIKHERATVDVLIEGGVPTKTIHLLIDHPFGWTTEVFHRATDNN